MFLGEHKQPVSESGRLQLPEQILSELEDGLVVARGFDNNLILFPEQEWQVLAGNLLKQPLTRHDVRSLRRRLFSAAEALVPDRNGRITLSAPLREFAGINGEVILAGMYGYVELWSPERWRSVRETIESDSGAAAWDDIGI